MHRRQSSFDSEVPDIPQEKEEKKRARRHLGPSLESLVSLVLLRDWSTQSQAISPLLPSSLIVLFLSVFFHFFCLFVYSSYYRTLPSLSNTYIIIKYTCAYTHYQNLSPKCLCPLLVSICLSLYSPIQLFRPPRPPIIPQPPSSFFFLPFYLLI